MEGSSVEAGIRAELMEVLDRLRILPAEAFAERTALRDRQAQLRSLLAKFEDPRDRETRDRWAEVPGRTRGDLDPVIIPPPPERGGGADAVF